MTYKISLIIAVYNAEKYLYKTIGSLLKNKNPIEIIVVNDKSTDKSLDILYEFQKENNNVVVVDLKENGGASNARNEGIKVATGEYLMFMDNDDFYDENAFDYVQEVLDEYNPDIFIYSSKNYYENGTKRFKKEVGVPYDKEYINGRDAFIDLYNSKEYSGCVWIRAFKKSLILNNNINFKKGIFIFEDDLFSLEAELNSKNVICRNKQIHNYLIRDDSLSADINNDPKFFVDFSRAYHYFVEIGKKYKINNDDNELIEYIRYFGKRAVKKYMLLKNEYRNKYKDLIDVFKEDIQDSKFGIHEYAIFIDYPILLRTRIKLEKILNGKQKK